MQPKIVLPTQTETIPRERTNPLAFLRICDSEYITHDNVVWYNNARQKDTDKLHRVVKQAGKKRCKVDQDKVCSEKVVVKAQDITDDTHQLHDNYKMLRSGRRWQSIYEGKNDPLLELICTPFNPPNESFVES